MKRVKNKKQRNVDITSNFNINEDIDSKRE